MRKIWSLGLINIKPGLLPFSCWVRDFNPQNQKLTHAQVWIKILDLPQEYWRPRFLFEIASSVGTPLAIDETTKIRLFGHYARILVDIDLSQPIFHKVLVEREGHAFLVEIVYEKQPLFCNNCRLIGHSIQQCYKIAQKSMDLNNENKKNYETMSHKKGVVNVEKNVDGKSTNRLVLSIKLNYDQALAHRSILDKRVDFLLGKNKQVELQIPQPISVNMPTTCFHSKVSTKVNTPLVELIKEGGNASTSDDLIEDVGLISSLGNVVDDTITEVEGTKAKLQVYTNFVQNLEIVPSVVFFDEGRATFNMEKSSANILASMDPNNASLCKEIKSSKIALTPLHQIEVADRDQSWEARNTSVNILKTFLGVTSLLMIKKITCCKIDTWWMSERVKRTSLLLQLEGKRKMINCSIKLEVTLKAFRRIQNGLKKQ